MNLSVDFPADRRLRVVALAAHPDDVEIGAGGLLLRLAASADVDATVIVATGSDARLAEATASASAFFAPWTPRVVGLGLPDGRLPARWEEVKDAVDAEAARGAADIVLAPRRDDDHQDHRVLADIAMTSFRSGLLLRYEVIKWDGDRGRANGYLPLGEDELATKIALLTQHFPSQAARDWFSEDTFRGLARIRGVECHARYAEAFWCDKFIIDLMRSRD